MSISTKQIKELREKTGAGVLDCRKALEASSGDFEAASAFLMEKGLAKAAKRADRATENGVLELYNHGNGRVGVMVEVNCETDFVARTDGFRKFAHEVALQIAAASPRYVSIEDIPDAVIEEQKESARKFALEEGKPEQVIDRIVEGRLQKYYQDVCLLMQEYVRDDSKIVDDLLKETIVTTGEKIAIRRFARWEVGEKVE